MPFEDLEDWIKEFHTLLVKISAKHAEFTTWSVTVGTPFSLTLTVDFANQARSTAGSRVLSRLLPHTGRFSQTER